MSSTGGDTNIDHKLKGKGTGQVKAYDPYITDYIELIDGLRNNSLFRQALVNGNFDIWQRNTSIALTTADGYTADRWYADTATAGDDKTISRQDGSGVNGSYYCARVQRVNGETGHTVLRLSQALESQDSIKFRGKKLTLSFYARKGANFSASSDILTAKIVTGKGTDQKLNAFTTSADAISENKTLTTSWQKFTLTTTDVIASDITQIGVSFSFDPTGTAGAADYFEITQVQLCAGDVALPFQPKSYGDELRECQRYYQKLLANGNYSNFTIGYANTTSSWYGAIWFPVEMRTIPTLETTGTASDYRVVDGVTGTALNAVPAIDTNADNAWGVGLTGSVAGTPLTQFRPYHMGANNSTSAYLGFNAEL
jgi:hypothetical protein